MSRASTGAFDVLLYDVTLIDVRRWGLERLCDRIGGGAPFLLVFEAHSLGEHLATPVERSLCRGTSRFGSMLHVGARFCAPHNHSVI